MVMSGKPLADKGDNPTHGVLVFTFILIEDISHSTWINTVISKQGKQFITWRWLKKNSNKLINV